MRDGTMTQRKYPKGDEKVLYSRAAGRCSFPSCRRNVTLAATEADPDKQIGKIAHIVGHSDNGPRGDPAYPREKLDTYENWILLCPTCHDTVDGQSNTHTVADLRQYKADHEQWVADSLAQQMPNVGFAELEVASRAIANTPTTPSEDFTVTCPLKKMEINGLTDRVDMFIKMGMLRSDEVARYLGRMATIDPDFPDRLAAGFVHKYNDLRQGGLSGDTIFEELREFSANGSVSFQAQAAGLAILTYLFERCEVFER